MAHPLRYADDDPLLARVRRACLALPEAKEKISHGLPNFYTVKVFAQFGAVVKGDHYADDFSQSLVFHPDAGERAVLLEDPRFFVPAYHGAYGWIGLNLRAPELDWTEVAELVDMSYRNTAPKRLVARLDGG
jgi:hypothetical protein